MFNVDIARLKTALEHRGLTAVKNNDGTVSINGVTYSRLSDVESFLEAIPRNDLGVDHA